MVRVVLAGLLAWALAMPATAQPIFKKAVPLWLDDNHDGIRQQLKLANNDNPAATILYSGISGCEQPVTMGRTNHAVLNG